MAICIPLAPVRLLPDWKQDVLVLLQQQNHKNSEAEKCGSRCCRFMSEQLKIVVLPARTFTVGDAASYLLHMERDGNPHCLACKVNENKLVQVWDGNSTTMLLSELEAFSEAAIDQKSLVAFKIVASAAPLPRRARDTATSETLLDLRSGAGDLHDEWAECLQNSVECGGPEPGSEECDVLEYDVEGEPAVMVGNTLLALLKAEVQEQLTNSSRKQHRCILCPFRSFQSPACSDAGARPKVSRGSSSVRLQWNKTAQDELLALRQRPGD